MNIGEFIRKYDIKDVEPLKMYWNKGVKFQDIKVNFYTLLCFVPLWRFNKMYNAWYAAGNEGAMGDFMSDEPTDKQIARIMSGRDLIFRKQKGVR